MTGSWISPAPLAEYLNLTKNLVDNGEEEGSAGGGEDPEVPLPSHVPLEPPRKWREGVGLGFFFPAFST